VYRSDGSLNTRVYNGGELLDMFKKNFSEDWLQEVVWAEYSIKFEYFNPMNGESSTVKYMIERKLKNNQKNS